jgi:hypothetical protein|nr:MAG TPA: hypothetical protein [Caudoviricetes sp.]
MDGQYMVRKRLRALSRTGEKVNIPYGTMLKCVNGIIYWKDDILCNDDCQMQKDYLVQANSPDVSQRAYLINDILKSLSLPTPDDSKVKERWQVLWKDIWANQFRRKDFEDFWLWSNKFYDAEEADLRRLCKLISKV